MAQREINELEDLDTKGVSLVKRGANRKRFALWKHVIEEEETNVDDMHEVLEAVLAADMDNEDEIQATLEKANLTPKALAAAKGALKLLAGFRDEMDLKPVMTMLGELLGTSKATPADKQAGKDKDKYEYPEPTKKEDEVGLNLDGLSAEDRAKVETLWKSHESVIKEERDKRESLEKQIAVERDERLRRDYMAKAETEYAHVPGKTEEIAGVLKHLHDRDPDMLGKVEALLKSTETAMQSSKLFDEIGSGARGRSDGTSMERLDKYLDRRIEKAVEPISKAKMIDQLLAGPEGADIYEQYLHEHPAQSDPRHGKS